MKITMKPTLTWIMGVAFQLVFTTSANAGNIYDSASGSLSVPVIKVDDSNSYSAVFTRVSQEPLVWGANEFTPIAKAPRTAAVYDAATASLSVPEINVQGVLYDLSFSITSGCGFAVCLEPTVSTLQNKGRDGAAVFTTALSTASTFSCASCHAMSEVDGLASDGFRRPGHDLENANLRPSYKNGQYSSFLDAVNTCVTEWMNAPALTEGDSDWVNLLNWFQDQNTDTTDATISYSIVEPPANLSGGDIANGRELFNTRCIVCHGFDGEGTQLAPKITGLGLTADYIARRTRLSGRNNSATYSGLTGGIMPFWGSDRLSDGELIDVVAFVTNGGSNNVVTEAEDPTGPSTSACTSNSPKIGQTATLSQLFHRVSGVATIIDDCTIELTNFNFDGGGIDVRIYGGRGGAFHENQGGFAISDNLVGIAFNDNTLRLTLPAGRTLDDLDSLSVWCVAVGVSFGTALF